MDSSNNEQTAQTVGGLNAGMKIFIAGLLVVLIGSLGPGSSYPKTFFIISLFLVATGSLIHISKKYLGLPPGIKNDNIMFDGFTSVGAVGVAIASAIMVFYTLMYWFPGVMKHTIDMFDP
jgi:hypothetical protein